MGNNNSKKVTAVVPEHKENMEEKRMGSTLYIGVGVSGNEAVVRKLRGET